MTACARLGCLRIKRRLAARSHLSKCLPTVQLRRPRPPSAVSASLVGGQIQLVLGQSLRSRARLCGLALGRGLRSDGFATAFHWIVSFGTRNGSTILGKITPQSQIGAVTASSGSQQPRLRSFGGAQIEAVAEAAKRLKCLMLELGWTPVRARAVTARGRASRVRGYAR